MQAYTMNQMMRYMEDMKRELAGLIFTDTNMKTAQANDITRGYEEARRDIGFLTVSYPDNALFSEKHIDSINSRPLLQRVTAISYVARQFIALQMELYDKNTQPTADDLARGYQTLVQQLRGQRLTLSHVVSMRRFDPNAKASALTTKVELLKALQRLNESTLVARRGGDQPWPDYEFTADSAMDEKLIRPAEKERMITAIINAIETTVPEPDVAGNPVSVGLVRRETIRIGRTHVYIGVEPTTDKCGHAATEDRDLCVAIRTAAQTALPEHLTVKLDIRQLEHPLEKDRQEVHGSLENMRNYYKRDPERLKEVLGYMLIAGMPFGNAQGFVPSLEMNLG